MTRLALVSDTHLPRFGTRLPAALLDALADAAPDVILHLGDHTAGFVVEQLAAVAPVEAVAGNNDPVELMARFGPTRILATNGVRIGLTHGHLGPGRTTPDRALAAFAGEDVAIVAFGHSHIPLVEWRGGRLLVNPGSPTDRRRQPAPTFALLDIDVAAPGGTPPAGNLPACGHVTTPGGAAAHENAAYPPSPTLRPRIVTLPAPPPRRRGPGRPVRPRTISA